MEMMEAIYSSRWRKSKYKSGYLGQSYMNFLTSAWGCPSKDAAGVFRWRGHPAQPVGTTDLPSVFSASVSLVCVDLGVCCIAIAAQHHPSVTRSRSLISVETRTRTHHRKEEKLILKVEQINSTITTALKVPLTGFWSIFNLFSTSKKRQRTR